MTLSTRIALMNHGRFEQVGTPGEVYEYPTNRFVANFVGSSFGKSWSPQVYEFSFDL